MSLSEFSPPSHVSPSMTSWWTDLPQGCHSPLIMSQKSRSVGKASLLMSLVSQIPHPLLLSASLPLLTLSTLPELSGQHPPLVKVHIYTFLMLWHLRISFKADGGSFSLPPGQITSLTLQYSSQPSINFYGSCQMVCEGFLEDWETL